VGVQGRAGGKGKNVSRSKESIVVRKNRKRAFWSLVIVLFMIPVSAGLLYAGLLPGRPDLAWALILFGLVGILAFGASAIVIIRTMSAPWHLELSPSHLAVSAPTYSLTVPWDRIAGIAVDDVNQRPGCVLVFDDTVAVTGTAAFRGRSRRSDAVTDAGTMQSRLEANFEQAGYHLGIPGRLLEAGAEELAELLAKGRSGQLWKDGEARR
jgi:hypothetical protein